MPDRWDEEDELDRGGRAGRQAEPDLEPTLGETIDGAVRRFVTGIVIAGGLIGLGVYWSGGDTVPDYQIATAADGRVYRLNTDSGSIVACQNNRCWLMQRGSRDLEDEPPAEAARPPAQLAPPQAAPAQVAPAQPAPQLPAPQNQQAPAAR